MLSKALRWVSGKKTPDRVWITRVWNLGTWDEWKEMKKLHSREEIIDVVKNPIQGAWTKHGKQFAEAVTGCTMSDDVLCNYDA
jgi:hypothetical protein